jgi:3-methyladenine DNA glycosylase AlkD
MEAQFIASITADPKRFTAEDARRWAPNSTAGTSSTACRTFSSTPTLAGLIEEFAEDEREFVRRTAFAMIAWASCTGRRSRTRLSSPSAS